jgi:hypothetical protein
VSGVKSPPKIRRKILIFSFLNFRKAKAEDLRLLVKDGKPWWRAVPHAEKLHGCFLAPQGNGIQPLPMITGV